MLEDEEQLRKREESYVAALARRAAEKKEQDLVDELAYVASRKRLRDCLEELDRRDDLFIDPHLERSERSNSHPERGSDWRASVGNN